MLWYVHMAYVHVAIQDLVVYSHTIFGLPVAVEIYLTYTLLLP